MAVDTRHWSWCSLGPLAPTEAAVTLADDHIQTRGLCMTKGTVILQGIHRPKMGDPVSLAYGNATYLARVPRRLRVLSSFADPLARTTTVSVGCLLALFENRRPPVTNPQEVEENATLSYTITMPGGGQQEVQYSQLVYDGIRSVAALPMSTKWVAQKILDTLGITAAGQIPLKIRRVTDEWDLSAGYVEELGRIADSESYFCWINEAEQLEFISKNQTDGSIAPLITGSEILSLQPVNVGDLPGDAVYAKYESAKLKLPIAGFVSDGQGGLQQEPLTEDEKRRRNWEYESVTSGSVQVVHGYVNSAGVPVQELVSYNDYSISETFYDGKDRVTKRTERSNSVNGERSSVTTFRYTGDSVVSQEIYEEYAPIGDVAAVCGKNGPIAEFRIGSQLSGTRLTTYDKDKSTGTTLTVTTQSTQYVGTQFGSNTISVLREEGTPYLQLVELASQLVPMKPVVRIRSERNFGLQQRPGQQQRNKSALQKFTPPDDGLTTQMTWAIGSPTSETAVEISPPYTSDDRVVATGTPPVYSVVAANAQEEALSYARVENYIRLGNRNGAGLQLSPLDMPARPFSPFYIRLNGCTAAYRTNGTTWTMGTAGTVCTTDALFRAAIDGAVADAWFPLPPGQSTLPSAAAPASNANPRPANAMAVPGGFNPQAPDLVALFAALPTAVAAIPRATLTPGGAPVRPWRETVPLRGGIRIGGQFTVQPWLAQTVPMRGGIRLGGQFFPARLLLQMTGGTGQNGSMALTLTAANVVQMTPPARGTGQGMPMALIYTPVATGLTQITTRAALGGTDFVSWGQFGATEFEFENPSDATTNLSATVSVSMQAGNNFVRNDQGNTWAGNFASGDMLLWTNYTSANLNILTLVLPAGIAAAGTQIQTNSTGSFTAKIEAFNSGNTSLGSFVVNGNSTTSGDNSAVFLGVRNSSAIAKIEISVLTAASNRGNYAINRLELGT